ARGRHRNPTRHQPRLGQPRQSALPHRFHFDRRPLRRRPRVKLATIHDGTADGRLVVVARDLEHVARADGIARTFQEALDRWDEVLKPLRALYDRLNAGTAAEAVA